MYYNCLLENGTGAGVGIFVTLPKQPSRKHSASILFTITFPLLPLDGGHAAIATYERIRSRKGKKYVADINKLIPVTWVVITVLVGIALLALYRDIVDLPNFG